MDLQNYIECADTPLVQKAEILNVTQDGRWALNS